MSLFGPDPRRIALAVEAAWPLVPWYVMPVPSEGITVWHAAPAAGFVVDIDGPAAKEAVKSVWDQVACSLGLQKAGRTNAKHFFSIAVKARDGSWYGTHFFGEAYGPSNGDRFM